MSRRQFRHVRNRSKFGPMPKREWFINQKRSVRRRKAVALRWRIASDPNGGGVFHSHQFIPGSPAWIAEFGAEAAKRSATHWADIYFMSTRPIRDGIFYNTTIRTLADKVVADMEDEADEAVDALLSAEELKNAFTPPTFERIGNSKFSTMVFSKNPTFAALDGLTRYGAQARHLRNALETLPSRRVTISCKKQLEYAYGVGLDMVSNAQGLTVNSIVHDIERFRAMGEQDFEVETDITPHLSAIRGMLLFRIASLQRMDAHDRGVDEPAFDVASLSDEERTHFHSDAVPINV